MKPYHEVLLGFGSNLGDRLSFLTQALNLLNEEGVQVKITSRLYFTPPVGIADREFLNCVILCHTELEPEAVLEKILLIEKKLGRIRLLKWENRCIDLDILMWRTANQSLIVNIPLLAIPHPLFLERNFTLVPAAEIAADWLHPSSGKTLKQELESRAYCLSPSDIKPNFLLLPDLTGAAAHE